MKTKIFGILLLLALFGASCDKGYQVRFVNYYNEPIDSVVVGSNKLVFKAIELQAKSPYYDLSKGKYGILIVSKTKKRFSSSITIPSTGTGKRTIQIDGIEQISILEE